MLQGYLAAVSAHSVFWLPAELTRLSRPVTTQVGHHLWQHEELSQDFAQPTQRHTVLHCAGWTKLHE